MLDQVADDKPTAGSSRSCVLWRRSKRPRRRGGKQDNRWPVEALVPRSDNPGSRRGLGADRASRLGVAPAGEGATEEVPQERVSQYALQLHAWGGWGRGIWFAA